MLIDNKKKSQELNITTVWDFIVKFSGKESDQKGKLDIVTGYFMIQTLAKLYDSIPEDTEYRIISSQMVSEDSNKDQIVNLLSDSLDIDRIGTINEDAPKAIKFLERPTVQMRAELPDFCHAKAYLFTNSKASSQSYYVTGSSNLTPSGLGLKNVPNVELNIAKRTGAEEVEFKEIKEWYDDIWSKARTEIPENSEDKNSVKIPVKEYFIRKIKEYFREYSPKEIYYKILFELFNSDLNLDGGIEHTHDMTLLQTSKIWNTLFPYQQQGVISLIKMLRKYNGAILADAVGLGKTFSALAVIKYFQTQNYTTVLLCPKKLEQNWKQYIHGAHSRFDKDEFKYEVRFHTDLQNDRLQTAYDKFKLDYLQTRKKVLIVIDESHNLRNERSGRYKDLLYKLIQNIKGQENRDVKVLLLSATPINTGLKDVKGQFNLIARGNDNAFDNDEFGVDSLDKTFREAQSKYTVWCEEPDRTIGSFIKRLPPKFFNLTDKLIVARTRKFIEKKLQENLGFPEKAKPENIYQGVDHFGEFKTAQEIYDSFEKLNLTAYQPSIFIHKDIKTGLKEASSDWDDDINREMFLVKMMCMLFMKRLESSWFSLGTTVKKVLDVHSKTLEKVLQYESDKTDYIIRNGEAVDDEDYDEHLIRRREIRVSDIKNLSGFKKALEADCAQLAKIHNALSDFESKYRANIEHDLKLEKLVEIINKKKESQNKKIVIFTAYSDTAEFLFNELKASGFTKMAAVTGQKTYSTGGHSVEKFTEVLQSFAPFSKLYNELDWEDLYEEKLDPSQYYNEEKQRWNVPYDIWKELIRGHRPQFAKLLDDEIDILIATDCLSEGQNLQDADLQVNYDIHWNPVRLIQRFGRIDRIGSPNKTISCVNFWPATSFEAYLKLEKRIQNRMSIMTLVGSETQDLNERYEKLMADNEQRQDANADRLLRELQNNSISDIETAQTLSLKDFSLETYRQELVDYYEKQKDFYRRMPNGIFSGFVNQSAEFPDMPESLIALVGYPKKEEGKKDHTYTELYIMCQPIDSDPSWVEINKAEILEFLRKNKDAQRYVPEWVVENDVERVAKLSEVLKEWMKAKAPQQAAVNIKDRLKSKTISSPSSDKKKLLQEQKFQLQNFDLIVWEYITKSNN